MTPPNSTASSPTESSDHDLPELPLPPVRCLSKDQAAAYLGVGLTLLAALDIPCVKFGRRRVYDKIDLDAWLEEYKQRGRAGKEFIWPVKPVSTGGRIPATGGSVQRSQMAREYAKALGLNVAKKQKPC